MNNPAVTSPVFWGNTAYRQTGTTRGFSSARVSPAFFGYKPLDTNTNFNVTFYLLITCCICILLLFILVAFLTNRSRKFKFYNKHEI